MMVSLRCKNVEEDDWISISNLLEYMPSLQVYKFAESWLEEYPDHDQATKLLGQWLSVCGSRKATKLAIQYLNRESVNIKPILLATNQVTVRSNELYEVIENKLESSPSNIAWSCLQTYKGTKPINNRLVSRWLTINLDNPDILPGLYSIALFSSSLEVLQLLVDWVKKCGENDSTFWMAVTLQHLLIGRSDAHEKLRATSIELAELWISAFPENENCGLVVGALVRNCKTEEDFQKIVDWYEQHAATKTSYLALSAFLHGSYLRKREIEPHILELSMLRLRTEPALRRVPVFVKALLDCHPVQEVINTAREICLDGCDDELMVMLLRQAPDDEIIERARKRLNDLGENECVGRVLVALLTLNPNDVNILNLAKKWLRRNQSHDDAFKLKQILGTKAKR